MKASELRAGNLIQYISIKNPVEVLGTDCRNESVIIGNSVAIIENQYEPIPLTEEWLTKFGFKDTRILLPGDGELEIRLKGGTFHIWPLDGQTESHNFRNLISYVHELQNLYFALAGEELTI